MVYKVTPKSENPLITYLDRCVHMDFDFEGKILLDNQSEIIITNKTRFKIYGDYIKLTNPSYPNACIKIANIIGVTV